MTWCRLQNNFGTAQEYDSDETSLDYRYYQKLGWIPRISFRELVAEMVREDLKVAERDELVKKHGYQAFDYNE